MMQANDATVPAWLLGRWRLQRAEPELEMLPGTRMEFRTAGELIYIITVEGREAAFSLRYRVDGDILRTVYEDSGQRADVRFGHEATGLLEFDFDGRKAWFIRERLQ